MSAANGKSQVKTESMRNERSRGVIADEAVEWLVTNREGSADARRQDEFMEWLKSSPRHVQEYLGVSLLALDLQRTATKADLTLQDALALARSPDDTLEHPAAFDRAGTSAGSGVYAYETRRLGWIAVAAVVMAAGTLLWWSARDRSEQPLPMHYATRHGEQTTERLADGSVLHLDTDSAVTIRLSKTQRLVTLTAGQADFEVAHDPARAFRVFAGTAEVVAVGTNFNVRLEHGSTVITVVEGRVAVGLSSSLGKPDANLSQANVSRLVQVNADQQIRVTTGEWPATPLAVDAQQATAWLHREIVFDHEPLERVAAEFNRYAAKPIEIATPALRNLQISGAFATDDTEAFIAFLRSLKGVRVEVTATRIRVSQP